MGGRDEGGVCEGGAGRVREGRGCEGGAGSVREGRGV